jgi:hypothetical protein
MRFFATFAKREDRLRLENKNEQVHFVLRSACTIFAPKSSSLQWILKTIYTRSA